MRRIRLFLQNALILCVTSVGLRLIGIFFNAYLISRIGVAGIGLFQLIMTVYGLFITLAASGVSMSTMRLIAEELSRSNSRGVHAVARKTFRLGTVIGCAACALMLLLAPHVGRYWLSDERTIASLRILAFSLPFIAMSSVLKGYFTAVRRVSRSAAVDVAEQLFRMASIVYMITVLFPPGLEYACVAIALGNSAAEIFSFALLYLMYRLDIKRFAAHKGRFALPLSRVMSITLPVALNSYLRAGFNTVSKLLVPTTLQRYGLTKEQALAEYGKIQGMVFPILQLPEMFLSSFASLMVPELTDMHQKKDWHTITRSLSLILSWAFYFSIATVGVLSCFAKEISFLMYHDDVSLYLAALAPLTVFIYLDRVVDNALTGFNEQVNSMLNNLLESVLNTVLIIFLVPRFGMPGYIAVLFAGKSVNMWLSITRLMRVTQLRIPFTRWVICPVAAILLSIFAVTLARQTLLLPWGLWALLLLILYALLLQLFGVHEKAGLARP